VLLAPHVQHRHNEFPQIERVHTVHPNAGELFYLRLLLHNEHSRRKSSFGALRLMTDGTQPTSYKEACRYFGLLQDDAEWNDAMVGAASTAMPAQLRALYLCLLRRTEDRAKTVSFETPNTVFTNLVPDRWLHVTKLRAFKYNEVAPHYGRLAAPPSKRAGRRLEASRRIE